MDFMMLNKTFFKVILIIMLVVMCNSCVCYAALKDDLPEAVTKEDFGPEEGTGEGTVQTGGLPDLSIFEPSVSAGGAVNVFGNILGILRIIGAVMATIAIVMIGFYTILGSASEKAEYQQKLIGIIFHDNSCFPKCSINSNQCARN